MKYFCNPVNIEYQYQMFQVHPNEDALCSVHREAADPSVVLFRGIYYLFPSMSAGFYTSTDLVSWERHEFLGDFPIYGYAPDVRVFGDYLYCCASAEGENGSFYRTHDPLSEPFEEIAGDFPFWDPNLFVDDDRRVYLYWGSSNAEPIYGIELNPETMRPLGERIGLIDSCIDRHGFERMGENYVPPKTKEEIDAAIAEVMRQYANEAQEYAAEDGMEEKLYRWFGNSPYMEGPWMTKYNGKYYLQYAVSGTEYNVYADGVYVSDDPLGPFVPAKNNPYSYKPAGFITAAGHGSTFADKSTGFWHISTMRVSVRQSFERRLGLWRAAFDADGELCCDQRYGDWPQCVDAPIWEKPKWMLLSYQKPVTASSGTGAQNVTNEDIRTYWQAEHAGADEWIMLDLGEPMQVNAVQINFADDWTVAAEPDMEFQAFWDDRRHIDSRKHTTRWILEGSADGKCYEIVKDCSGADTDFPHDLVVWEEAKSLRFLRLRAMELPYGQRPCVSGLRVFGRGTGMPPEQTGHVLVTWETDRPTDALDMCVSWDADHAVGHNILWGHAPDKLYHSCMVYGNNRQSIGALVKDAPVYVRVDAFNENGITEGDVLCAR